MDASHTTISQGNDDLSIKIVGNSKRVTEDTQLWQRGRNLQTELATGGIQQRYLEKAK